jgi:hypothetical protein
VTSSVEQVGAPLVDVAQQPGSLAAAVAAGELWMEAGVAEKAAARCDKAVEDIDFLLMDARWLVWDRKFGDNQDGNRAAERFLQAARDYIDTMRKSQKVFANMAVTYRAAGRTVTEADEAGKQMFAGRSE